MAEPNDTLTHAGQYGLDDAFDEAIAAEAGHVHLVHKLLALGAPVDATRPLDEARQRGDTLEALLTQACPP